MIEPTESESRAELDRFCDAMISIRSEIAAIENKAMDSENNVLKNAPHTVFDLTDESWSRPYARTVACFPVKSLLRDKYWCPVNRVDNAYGDRHLVCSCPPMESYRSAAE
jgi:glycine cleavage system P protein (glycine dehydrogenase)